jgi:hypothetical protein
MAGNVARRRRAKAGQPTRDARSVILMRLFDSTLELSHSTSLSSLNDLEPSAAVRAPTPWEVGAHGVHHVRSPGSQGGQQSTSVPRTRWLGRCPLENRGIRRPPDYVGRARRFVEDRFEADLRSDSHSGPTAVVHCHDGRAHGRGTNADRTGNPFRGQPRNVERDGIAGAQ